MSIITFELKEEHVKLLKNLRWSVNNNKVLCGVGDEGDDIAPPFGETNLYEAINIILNGRPVDFNPLENEDAFQCSDEQKAEWDKLYAELPMALDVILFNGNFDLGNYRTRYHDRNWKKLKH